MQVEFEFEKETKRTIRFTEVSNDISDEPVCGTMYIQKHALDEMDYDGESNIIVNIEVE